MALSVITGLQSVAVMIRSGLVPGVPGKVKSPNINANLFVLIFNNRPSWRGREGIWCRAESCLPDNYF